MCGEAPATQTIVVRSDYNITTRYSSAIAYGIGGISDLKCFEVQDDEH